MPAIWFALRIEVPRVWEDAIGNFLIEQGAPGLQCEEHEGGSVCLIAHFTSEPPVGALREFCAALPGARFRPLISIERIAEEDWAENWKIHFQPQLIGNRLYVCPPWDVAPPPSRIAIVIEPGMAFGTGQHSTTRGCLTLLERLASERRIERALDLGTGSGILALALAKLGVPEVWAVDTDAAACVTARQNCLRNGVTGVYVTDCPDSVVGTFDLLVANLFANVLLELSRTLAHWMRLPGMLICSGFLLADEARVRRAYEIEGYQLSARYEEDTWVTLALQRSAEE